MGIGGAGMSGLALLLDQIGCKVSGCDAVGLRRREDLLHKTS